MSFFSTIFVRWLYPYGCERRVLLGPVRGMKYIVERGNDLSFGLGRRLNIGCPFGHVCPGMVVYDAEMSLGQAFGDARSGPSSCVYPIKPVPARFKAPEGQQVTDPMTGSFTTLRCRRRR